MSRPLKTIIASAALFGLAACASIESSYDLPRFEQINSTAQSCKEIEETKIKLTFHDVIIDEYIDEYDQNGMNPIVISGEIPTTDYNLRRIANAIDQGRDDEYLREHAEKVLKMAESYGNEYPDREERLNRIVESHKRIMVGAYRHDGVVLYISPEIYTKSVAQYVEDKKLVGKFTIDGEVGCSTPDEYKKAKEKTDSNIPEMKVGGNFDTFMTRYFETHSFKDLLIVELGHGVNSRIDDDDAKPNFLLHLKIKGIEKTGKHKGYWNSGT